jgi:hypothetical protein
MQYQTESRRESVFFAPAICDFGNRLKQEIKK